ncbi:GNAT family N-acetyltransferase [Pedobacter sp. N23S346]|uniref:GNAT family N-acetyltransferase n=1 Tax=Pedobacter sp. N23S346 TaxID=3402750 RepID=UPI003AD4B094
MIRKAKPSDSKFVVPLIIQAMGELAGKFANSNDSDIIFNLFEYFFQQKENQYSYQNTLVFTSDDEILGAINAYDGAQLYLLRKPLLDYLETQGNAQKLSVAQETEEGEFYIDTVSVKPEAQGKGIGKLLIYAAIDWAKELNHRQVGLLVEKNNPGALKLYQKIGFYIKNDKTFLGGEYHHMVYSI